MIDGNVGFDVTVRADITSMLRKPKMVRAKLRVLKLTLNCAEVNPKLSRFVP